MARTLDLTGWTPVRLHGQGAARQVEWVYTGDLRFTDPFFDQTINEALRDPFALLFRRRTPLRTLLDWGEASPGLVPSGFVFHLSRSGSTLVTHLLAQSPRLRVLSEPGPVDALLRAEELGAERIPLLRALVSALGQPLDGEIHLVLKLDSWNTVHLELVEEAFPDVPWIFLFRKPLDVLVSQLRQTGVHGIPGALPPELFGLTHDEAAILSRERYIARVLERICQAALAQAGKPGGLFVDYTELPTFVLDRLPTHFDFALTEDERERMAAAALLDAKNPAIPFSPEAGSPSSAAIAAARTLDPLYERLRAC